MCAADDSPDGFVFDAAGQLRHDLITQLTVISAQSQLLRRFIQRTPSLTDEERTRILVGFAAIETAVQTMCAVIDTIASPSSDGPASPTGDER